MLIRGGYPPFATANAIATEQILKTTGQAEHGRQHPAAPATESKRQMIQRMGRIPCREPDGRAARFVALHITGTAEGPVTGAHAAFLDQLLPHAVGVSAGGAR